MTTNRWWSEFKGIGSLLVDVGACDECMKNTSPDWTPLEPRLMKVITANDFGYALFAMQAQHIFKSRLSRVAETVVKDMLQGKPITSELVSQAREVFDSKLKVLGASGDTTFPAEAHDGVLQGGGVSFDVVSYNDWWKAHVQALVRSIGAATDKLKALFGEKALVEYSAPPGVTVADALLGPSQLFRENATELARQHDAHSGDKLKALFDKKKKWFHPLDAIASSRGRSSWAWSARRPSTRSSRPSCSGCRRTSCRRTCPRV